MTLTARSFTRSIIALLIVLFSIIPVSSAQGLLQPDEAYVQSTLESMTLDQKIGQVLCPLVQYGIKVDGLFAYNFLVRDLERYEFGGLHIAGGNAADVLELTNDLQSKIDIPLLFTSDLEGGAGLVLNGATLFPHAMALASTNDEELVAEVGRITAREGRAAGLHVNFYPIVDVNTEPQNPIINYRAFSSSVILTKQFSMAYAEALQNEGMLATAKHYPGHGASVNDSHAEPVTIEMHRRLWESFHLKPFELAIERGIAAIMPGHIIAPDLGDPDLPATLSPVLIQDRLRSQMGFDGLIVSDSMMMQAITDRFSHGDAAVMALQAGVDLLLFPPSLLQYTSGIRSAVEDGRLPIERLDDAVANVLRAKTRLNLHNDRMTDPAALSETLLAPEHVETAREVAVRSIILHKNNNELLPANLNGADIFNLQIGDLGSAPFDGRGQALIAELREQGATVDALFVGGDVTPESTGEVAQRAENADMIIVTSFLTVAAFKERIALRDDHRALVDSLEPFSAKTVLTVFGSPYAASDFEWIDSVVIGCDILTEMQRAAVRAMAGENEFTGVLPVNLSGQSSNVDGFVRYR